MGKGYSFEVDFWALVSIGLLNLQGLVLYEMLSGINPLKVSSDYFSESPQDSFIISL